MADMGVQGCGVTEPSGNEVSFLPVSAVLFHLPTVSLSLFVSLTGGTGFQAW